MRRYIQTEVEDRIAAEIIAHRGKLRGVEVDVEADSLFTRVI